MSEPPARDWLTPDLYRVNWTRRELPDTVTLELQPIAGPRPAYLPGQFNMLYAFGVGEVAISISGDAAKDGVFVHTIRDVGLASGALTRLQAGATVGLRGPFGTGWPVAEAVGRDIVIAAGGLGLAPLRPAIYHVLNHRAQYGHVVLLVGSRNPDDLLFRDELDEWHDRLELDIEVTVGQVRKELDSMRKRLDVTVTVDHADVAWRGNVGGLTTLIPHQAFDPHNTVAMLCGPEVMMRYAANALGDVGVTADRVYMAMERNMKCAVGLCGHCQFGPTFICKDGPVMRYDKIGGLMLVREV